MSRGKQYRWRHSWDEGRRREHAKRQGQRRRLRMGLEGVRREGFRDGLCSELSHESRHEHRGMLSGGIGISIEVVEGSES